MGANRLMAAATPKGIPVDTPSQIFTAALVAEDLATTFYYNGLVGGVIQDPNLAGPGGTANDPNPTDSNPGNVNYLQAALYQDCLLYTSTRCGCATKSAMSRNTCSRSSKIW